MRVTGTGHASMRIDTAAGSILCDPWVNPAYFASWFPFPDNSQLDWETLGAGRLPLRVAPAPGPLRRRRTCARFVSKQATVLLPEYPTSELEDELRELGFTSFIKTRSNEPVELDGGLKIMIQALTVPTDGPIGDSSLWVEYDGVRLLNQNDARPTDLSGSPSWATCTRTCCSSPARSGTRWSTSCRQPPRPRSASRSGSGSSTGPCATSTT